MQKKIIRTANAPQPIGPYNQAVLVGNTLYIAGQIAMDVETGSTEVKDISEETSRIMSHLRAILGEAGMDFNDVVKTTIFLSDMALFSAVNEVYGTYFTSDYPARETVAVKGLPKNVNVEISMIAAK
jgi:2-iminobutanoate/2-iminopropanoate deaminase